MVFSKNRFLVKDTITSVKLKRTSNASLNLRKLEAQIPLQVRFKKLQFFKKNLAGRGLYGRLTVYTKGSVLKRKKPIINYFFREQSIFFTAGIQCIPGANPKLATLIFSSSGKVTYLVTKPLDNFFHLSRLKSLGSSFSRLYRELLNYNSNIHISEVPHTLLQQKKNRDISAIEATICKGIQYTRSFGSSSSIIKLDTRTGLGLVKLSSGVKKIFSAFSLASCGPVNLKLSKKDLSNRKSGFYRNYGISPIVRGVAKNPVDHPHGGRTKAIKYQRTPWGKTTKFK